MTSTILLEAKDLLVERGGTRVLDVPSFFLHNNETVAIIGPNGAGKSSLLLTLANLLPATGALFFKQEEIDLRRDGAVYRRRLAMVFQEPLLFDATVAENVASGLKIRGKTRKEISQKVDACLERFRISHLSQRSARKLSGGEAQRTSLARAFATDPELILLDEPFSSLDPLTRKVLVEDLRTTIDSSGVTAVITTHDSTDVSQIADRIMVMEGGKIIQSGLVSAVKEQPANQFAAAFFGV